MKKEK